MISPASTPPFLCPRDTQPQWHFFRRLFFWPSCCPNGLFLKDAFHPCSLGRILFHEFLMSKWCWFCFQPHDGGGRGRATRVAVLYFAYCSLKASPGCRLTSTPACERPSYAFLWTPGCKPRPRLPKFTGPNQRVEFLLFFTIPTFSYPHIFNSLRKIVLSYSYSYRICRVRLWGGSLLRFRFGFTLLYFCLPGIRASILYSTCDPLGICPHPPLYLPPPQLSEGAGRYDTLVLKTVLCKTLMICIVFSHRLAVRCIRETSVKFDMVFNLVRLLGCCQLPEFSPASPMKLANNRLAMEPASLLPSEGKQWFAPPFGDLIGVLSSPKSATSSLSETSEGFARF